ncbi:hypothetical protein DSM107133_01539 [Pseudosulfitobacter sp. DSM 107133]|nr:hypothetical protein DSM107133_01539 [Pseudosulfitobacter sp. DSM 107133]
MPDSRPCLCHNLGSAAVKGAILVRDLETILKSGQNALVPSKGILVRVTDRLKRQVCSGAIQRCQSPLRVRTHSSYGTGLTDFVCDEAQLRRNSC